MRFRNLIPAFAALFLIPAGAYAQNADGDKAEQPAVEKYNGDGFSLEPPAGWILVTGSLGESERKKLPANILEHYEMRNTDVLFLNLSSRDAESKGFKDSLNIVTIGEAIPLTDELVTELSNVLTQQYTSMFEKFELEGIEITTLGDRKVLQVKGKYPVLEYSVKMEQILVPSKKDSLVLTCTYDSGKEDAADVIGACRKAMQLSS